MTHRNYFTETLLGILAAGLLIAIVDGVFLW